MIDISTEAKMLLMNNRTTLFKADLIIQEETVPCEGKNLDNHTNSITGSAGIALNENEYVTFETPVSDLSSIPSGLIAQYKYAIVSIYIACSSISESKSFCLGIKSNVGGVEQTNFDDGRSLEMQVSDYVRYVAVFRVSDLGTSFDGIIGKFETSPTSATINYRYAMCELNNTGNISDYVPCYVVNGGSYGELGFFAITTSLTGDDVMANTVVFSDSVSSSNSFDIGSAIINSLSLTLNNYDDRFSLYDFTGAKIRPYIGIPLETTEWITKGYYTVDKPTSIGNTIPLTMLDNMSKFEKPYREVIQTFPATVSQILQSICIYCGVVLDNTTFTNSTLSIPSRPEDENLSCLDMVSAIAQLAGCYARINNQGYLQMMWYDTEAFNDDSEDCDGGTFLTNTTPYSDGDSLDGGDFSYDGTEDSADGGSFTYGDYFSCYAFNSFSIGTDDITITGIKVTVDSDNYYAVGEDGYVLELSNNPLITAENMESVAQFLGNKIIGMKFRPFNVSALSDPTVEAGDAIRLTDRKGNYYDSFVTSCSYKFGNYESFACNAESVSQRNATNYSPLTKAVEQARKDTQKALSSYDQAVVEMNNIALNSMGYYSSYTEELDGSRTSYIHNKPSRGESTILWKLSASGFFLSTNGGTTWVSGWDANGNAVYNILNAIGIRCDWIKAGILTLGGSDNVDGLLSILNANGVQVVRGDKDGLYAIAGTIGGMKLSNNSIGAVGSGMAGVLIDAGSGKVDWSWSNRLGSWSRFQSGANFGAGQMEHMLFWTGAGGSTGSEGIWVTNAASGTDMGNYIRHGSQQIYRSDGQYVQWGSGSDKRIKKNIKELASDFVKDIFKKLKPVKFQYNAKTSNDRTKTHYGVIAQDMEEIFDEKGIKTNFVSDTDDGWKFVNYHEFHGLELAAIKDLYNTIDRQQAEINELKHQVKYLMEKVGG